MAKKRSFWSRGKPKAVKATPKALVPKCGILVQARLDDLQAFDDWPGLEGIRELGLAEFLLRERLVGIRLIAARQSAVAERASACVEDADRVLSASGPLSDCLLLWPAHAELVGLRQAGLLESLRRLARECVAIQEDMAAIELLKKRWRKEWEPLALQLPADRVEEVMRSILGHSSADSLFASLRTRAVIGTSVVRVGLALETMSAIVATHRHAVTAFQAEDARSERFLKLEGASGALPSQRRQRVLEQAREDVTGSGLNISAVSRRHLSLLQVRSAGALTTQMRRIFGHAVKEPLHTWLQLFTSEVR